MKPICSLIVAAGLAAAPAFAQDVIKTYQWDPVTRTYIETSSYVVPESTVTYVEPAPVVTTYVEGPAVAYTEPDIVVTAPRSVDQAINNDVVDTLASDPRLSGKVGVETYNREVTLTGRLATPVQVERAERDARSVDGVREVNNRLRARVGEF